MLPEVLVGCEHGQHVLVFGNLAGVGNQTGLAIRRLDGLHQIDRNQRIFHQLEFAIEVFKIGPAHVFAPFMGLHDPAAVLAVRFAFGAGHVFTVHHVFGFHAGRVLGMAADYEVEAFDRSGHLHIARRLGTVVAIFVMPHMGRGDHDVGLGAQFGQHLCGLGNRAAELDVFQVVRAGHFGRVFGREAHHAYT